MILKLLTNIDILHSLCNSNSVGILHTAHYIIQWKISTYTSLNPIFFFFLYFFFDSVSFYNHSLGYKSFVCYKYKYLQRVIHCPTGEIHLRHG